MKQIIVLIAMIMLGIAIAGLVGDFGQSASDLKTSAVGQLDQIVVAPPAV